MVMGIEFNPAVPIDNCVLLLDANNRKSFIEAAGNQSSLMNTSTWTVGTGPVTGYAVNGANSESQRLVDTDPWGNQSIVWQTNPDGAVDASGGWNGSSFAIDNTKTYRFSVWMRRISSTSSGSSYLGLHTNGTGDTIHLSDGASQTNPYWDYRGTSSLTQNQWYLFVGHIFPSGWVGTTAHPDSGMYLAGITIKQDSNRGNVPNDVKFPSNATTAMMRVYHYYSSDTTTHLQFAFPRVDLIDGSQPSISELISRAPSKWYDISGNNNHATMYGAVPYSVDVETCFDFSSVTGATSPVATLGFTFASNMIPRNGNYTFSVWVKNVPTTVGQSSIFSNSSNGDGFRFGVGANGVYVLCGLPYSEITITYTSNFTNTQWNNVVVVFDRSGVLGSGTPRIYMYLNGVLQGNLALSSPQMQSTSAAPGIVRNACCTVFTGKLAILAAYSGHLSADQIMQNYNASKGRFGL